MKELGTTELEQALKALNNAIVSRFIAHDIRIHELEARLSALEETAPDPGGNGRRRRAGQGDDAE